MSRFTRSLGTHILAGSLGIGGALGTWQLLGTEDVSAAVAQPTQRGPAVTALSSFADVIETVSPAVVNIAASRQAIDPFRQPEGRRPMPWGRSFEDFFRRFFQQQSFDRGPAPGGMPRATGSGFVVDPDGVVVTNNHVVEAAEEIVVTLSDGVRYPAELVGTDPETDLAVLRIHPEDPVPFVEFGDSDSTRVGDWVIAIGNPFGLGGTATTGIVSARGRDIQAGPFDDFLQIDAPINQGNSGGPLFDTNGRVIGVNTAIYSPNGGNVGIGFAIPASLAAPVVEELRATGAVERGWLGVQIQSVDATMADAFGLDEAGGALVASVVEDSPAERAGLRAGDVVVGFDGQPVDDIRTLVRRVADTDPERPTELEVWRDGERLTLRVSLDASPQTEGPRRAARERSEAEPTDRLGFSLAPLTGENRRRYEIADSTEGALVVDVTPGSPAAARGLRRGDVILRVGAQDVEEPSDVVAEVTRQRDDERSSVVFHIARGNGRRFVAVPFA